MPNSKHWAKVKEEYLYLIDYNQAEREVIEAADWEIAQALHETWELIFDYSPTINIKLISEIRDALA